MPLKMELDLCSHNQGEPGIAGSHQTLDQPKKDSSLELSEGAWPCQRLDLRLGTSRSLGEYLWGIKPLSLWSFVRAALQTKRWELQGVIP